MKNYSIVLLLFLVSLTFSACSISPVSSKRVNTDNIKFTMPNRQIENIQETNNDITKPEIPSVNTAERMSNTNSSKNFIKVSYLPMSKAECLDSMDTLGLKYCPYNNDHLAGAAKACGHLHNLPSGEDLHKLARQVYHTNTGETSIYGKRDDDMLKKLGIYAEDSHIFYWTGEEYKDGERGFVRMFAARGTIPYYASRDGSGYYTSNGYNKVNYGNTRYITLVNTDHDSNLAGLPNNDVLMAICYK